MSYETTMARAAAAAAATAWKHHLGVCSDCRRQPKAPRCEHGREIFRDKQQAAYELARNRELDRQPPPARKRCSRQGEMM